MRRVVFAVEHPDNDTEKHGYIGHEGIEVRSKGEEQGAWGREGKSKVKGQRQRLKVYLPGAGMGKTAG